MIITMSRFFIQDNTTVYDLGCSTGRTLKKLKEENWAKNITFIGIDKEERFSKHWKDADIQYLIEDLKNYKFKKNSSLMLSMFTLQFLTTYERKNILKEIYESLITNGALILCEKVYSEDPLIQDVFTFSNYDYKTKYFSHEEILNKEKELRAAMNILGINNLIDEIKDIGFKRVDCFWKAYNFIGLLVVK
jgi:tRNA (cmo5U34)-methyltransferase